MRSHGHLFAFDCWNWWIRNCSCGLVVVDTSGVNRMGRNVDQISFHKWTRKKEAMEIREDVVPKLEKALKLSPTNHKAWSYLALAHRHMASRPDLDAAMIHYDKAFRCYLEALQLCPGNKDYIKCLKKVATRFPEMHKAWITSWHLLLDRLRGGSSTIQDADQNQMERVRRYQQKFCPKFDPKAMDADKLMLEHTAKTFVAEFAKDPSCKVNCGEWLDLVLEAFRDGDITSKVEQLQVWYSLFLDKMRSHGHLFAFDC